jgi:hypothetical protein
MTTTRITAGAGCVEIMFDHVTYTPDADGVFSVPTDAASHLVNAHTAAYAPEAAAPVAPLAYNPAYGIGGSVITLNNDAGTRLLVLEIAHWASIHKSGEMPLMDSAGERHMLTAAECNNLATQFRDRLSAAA